MIIIEIIGSFEDSNLKMFDFSGRLRYEAQVVTSTRRTKIDIMDRDYDPGMYIEEMVIYGQNFIEKILVVK